MNKPRTRYVAGIIYKGENHSKDEYDLYSLKGMLFEEALEHYEECKKQAKKATVKCKAVLWELCDSKRS